MTGDLTPHREAMPARPKGLAIDHRIAIAAPAEAVWAVLADVAAWGDWNPVYPHASGSISPGAGIALTIALPGMKPQTSRAIVYSAIPARALQFGASAFLGLLHATRYIEIRPAAAGGCTVVNGEAFGRLLGGPLVKKLGETIRDGLRLQNEGLKAAVEAGSSQ